MTYNPNEGNYSTGGTSNVVHSHITHSHNHCDHVLVYCHVCDIVYCKKCGKEWGKYHREIIGPSYPYWRRDTIANPIVTWKYTPVEPTNVITRDGSVSFYNTCMSPFFCTSAKEPITYTGLHIGDTSKECNVDKLVFNNKCKCEQS